MKVGGPGFKAQANRLGGLGERRELPQWGLGRSPNRKAIFTYLEVKETIKLIVLNQNILYLCRVLFGCSGSQMVNPLKMLFF